MGYVARRYFKTISKASNHARYIAFRDRLNEFEKKGLFTEKEDLINTFDFTNDCSFIHINVRSYSKNDSQLLSAVICLLYYSTANT